MDRKLRISDRKILDKIFGPKRGYMKRKEEK
jgi:hypothetical protein